MGLLARLAVGLAAVGLLTACAGASDPSATAPASYYPGPPYWDPARGQRIDPLSGQPLFGSGR